MMNGASARNPPGAAAAGVWTRIATSFHSPLRSVPTGTLWRWSESPAAPAPIFLPFTHTSWVPARPRRLTPTDSSKRLRSCLEKKPSSTFTQARYQASAAASSDFRGPGTATARQPWSWGTGAMKRTAINGRKGRIGDSRRGIRSTSYYASGSTSILLLSLRDAPRPPHRSRDHRRRGPEPRDLGPSCDPDEMVPARGAGPGARGGDRGDRIGPGLGEVRERPGAGPGVVIQGDHPG